MERVNWHWIELIGFDNALKDYGVSKFLSRLCDMPKGISILFSHIDFVNNFKATKKKVYLEPCDCSYSGHKNSVEHSRQCWTNKDLKGLVGELHKYDIKVTFSIFNFFEYVDDNGKMVATSFCKKHKELYCLNSQGKVYESSISILKRFSDGSYYQDYLIGKIKEVIDYYNFDGIQVGDGISCNRPSILNGDFSNDMVEQFSNYLKAEKINANYSVLDKKVESKKEYKERRKYIVENLYYEFLLFTNYRWKDFYNKFYSIINPKKYLITINSFWTREPFEAFYRYGIDYSDAYRDGVFGLMVEDVSTTYPTLSKEGRGGFNVPKEKTRYAHYEFYLMQMLIKCYEPRFKQIPLLPINDTQEQWNAIHDASNELKRAIYRRNNSRVYVDDKYQKLAEAPFFCLSDGIPKEDWKALSKWNNTLAIENIEKALGYTLYYPKDNIMQDVKRYIKTREYGFHKLATMLLSYGTNISSAITKKDILGYNGSILALFPEFYSQSELKTLLDSKNGIVFISNKGLYGEKVFDNGKVFISKVNISGKVDEKVVNNLAKTFKISKCDMCKEDEHGAIWTSPLKYKEWDIKFINLLSELLNGFVICPKVKIDRECECKITSYLLKNGKVIVLVSNDEYYNISPQIIMPKEITSIKSLTKYDGYKVVYSGHTFTPVVPYRSMEVLEITY